jgi:O-antigen ligase
MLQGALDVSATRFVGGYTDPNEFAKLLLLALAITMSTDVIPAGFRRNLIAIVLCVSVFLTYSKMGVFIGIGVLAVGAIGWMMNTAEKSGYPFALGSGILMCLALTSILLFVPLREWHVTASFMNRIVPLNSFELGIEEKLDFLTTARWSIYKTSVAVFVNSPLKAQLLGVGYNGSRELLATSIGRVISTHSVYLQTLLDFGLIGTSLFLCMLIVSADWTGHGILGFLRRNGVMCIYLLTFGAIAWLFNWSNILFFACVGTPSFRCLYGKDMG